MPLPAQIIFDLARDTSTSINDVAHPHLSVMVVNVQEDPKFVERKNPAEESVYSTSGLLFKLGRFEMKGRSAHSPVVAFDQLERPFIDLLKLFPRNTPIIFGSSR